MPVTVVVGEPGAVMVPPAGPLTFVQAPLPTVGVLPVMVAVPLLAQMVWSLPASAGVGPGVKVMVTSSMLAVQGALATVQRKVYAPVTETVTLVVPELAFTKLAVPGPLNKLQEPLPTVGVLPAKAAVRPQTLASLPALAGVGF